MFCYAQSFSAPGSVPVCVRGFLFALTPTVFATGIPYTGDDNKVGLVIGLLVVSVIVIVLLLVLSAASKKKKGRK